MKIKVIIIAMLIGVTCFSKTALAGPAAEVMGNCMVESMTGKERKQVAQWLFFAIAAHPDMREFSKATENAQNNINEIVGRLVTRLLTENCPAQAQKAMKEEGSAAMRTAFGLVGKVAMQELTTNKEVTDSLSGFEKFIDKNKINRMFIEK